MFFVNLGNLNAGHLKFVYKDLFTFYEKPWLILLENSNDLASDSCNTVSLTLDRKVIKIDAAVPKIPSFLFYAFLFLVQTLGLHYSWCV